MHAWYCGAGKAPGLRGMQEIANERHNKIEGIVAEAIGQLPGKKAQQQVQYLHTELTADIAMNGDELFIDVAVAAPMAPSYIKNTRSHRVPGAAAEARHKQKEVKYDNALNPDGSQQAMRAKATGRRNARDCEPFILETTGRPAKKTEKWLEELFKGQGTILREMYRKISYTLARSGGELLVQAGERWGKGAQSPAQRRAAGSAAAAQ